MCDCSQITFVKFIFSSHSETNSPGSIFLDCPDLNQKLFKVYSGAKRILNASFFEIHSVFFCEILLTNQPINKWTQIEVIKVIKSQNFISQLIFFFLAFIKNVPINLIYHSDPLISINSETYLIIPAD